MQHPLTILALTAAMISCTANNMTVNDLPQIPDPAYAKGVSAPFCGVADGTLIVAGGANFPDKPLLEGGAKKVYDDIWALIGGEWVRAGHLPDSVAYGATFQVPGGLVLAGGSVRGVPSDKVYLLSLSGNEARLEELPSLPVGIAEAAAASLDGRLYLTGGSGSDAIYSCLAGEYLWEKVATLPMPLVQPLAFATGENLYIWGGFNPRTLEVPSCGWRYSGGRFEPCPDIPDGGTFTGSASTVLPDGSFMVVGGVNRDIFARALHNTPEDRIPYLSKEPAEYRFRSDVFVFDPKTCSWSTFASFPECALAGPGVTLLGDSIVVCGGEIKPGVRSPRLFKIPVTGR